MPIGTNVKGLIEPGNFEQRQAQIDAEAETVVTSIKKQARHHQKMTFQEEYRRFLERHQVAYDERYVWD